MKNGLLKAFSFILALSMVLSSMSIVIFASDDSKLGIVGGNVELDLTNEGTVTVSVVAKEDLIFYGIEGIWDINEQGENKFFTLTGITSETLDFSGRNFADEKTGEVIWVDDFFTATTTSAGTKIISATYKVAKNTPDGEYKVRFTSTVFTGADAIPDETETVYEAVIIVTHTGYMKGDIDLDGDVDSDDLTLLARHVGGIEEINNAVSLKNADTNEDGFVNSDDLTKHARYVGGIISSWDQE